MTIEKLYQILIELKSTLSKMLEVSKSKQEILINRNHEKLNSLINREQRLLNELNDLSNHQKILVSNINEEYHLPKQLNNITEMLKLMGNKINSKKKENLLQILDEIKSSAGELNTINAQNKMLIEVSREFIKGIIQAARGNDSKSIINRKM